MSTTCAAAKTYLEGKGVATRLGLLPVNEGPAAGQTILYFQAPWGLQFEAISYPDGMAYEKDAADRAVEPEGPGEVARARDKALAACPGGVAGAQTSEPPGCRGNRFSLKF